MINNISIAILVLIITWLSILILKRILIGILLVPLRQNQYFSIEKRGDEGRSAAGGSNFKMYVGYSIRVIKGVPEYFVIDKNGVPKQIKKEELGYYYGWFWRFIGAYPALSPGFDRIKKYSFSWGKITNKVSSEVNKADQEIEQRSETVDSFFDSFTYGIIAKGLITQDLQEFEIKFRLPLQLKNLFTACYGNMPTGTWLNQYISAVFEGAKSYVGSKQSQDLLKDDFKRGGAKDLTDHLQSYLKAAEKISGYGMLKEGIGVLDVVGKLTQEMKKAQEANTLAEKEGEAKVTTATKQKLADLQKAIGIEALNKAAVHGDLDGFLEKMPDNIKNNPELLAEMWKSYQISKLTGLQALNVPTTVMKPIS